MKKLLCLMIVCILFACSDFQKSFTESPPKDLSKMTTEELLKELYKPIEASGEVGRFQMVDPLWVIDTKEGYVWIFRPNSQQFKLLKFDENYQSALEAVQAYSSFQSLSDEEKLKRAGFSDEEISQYLEKKRQEKHKKYKVPSP